MQEKINRGSYFVEIMVALLMVGLIATSFLPLLSKLLNRTQVLKQYSHLESIAEYCGSYIFRWANFSNTAKVVPFNYYEDNAELEVSGEKRVNKLLWATPPHLSDTYLTDHYKVSITFKDTTNRSNSAGIVVVVWYDENLNTILDNNEMKISFSTIITHKKAT